MTNTITYLGVLLVLMGLASCGGGVKTQTVKIGGQEWMAENLNVSEFRNGDPVPEASTAGEWTTASKKGIPAWCYYYNDPANGDKYGKLYNWYAVNDPRGLAPSGWHLPSNAEWKILEMFLRVADADGRNYRETDDGEGGKMKEAGTTHWNSPNEGATNSSGFTALPGGCRFGGSFFTGGYFNGMGYYTVFWSSTGFGSGYAWSRLLSCDYSEVQSNYYTKDSGFSVRCLRD